MTVTDEILTKIKEYETIIIHRHQSPEPDALGSQGGLYEILHATFPEKNLYKVGGPINGLEYMTLMDEIEDSVYSGSLVITTDTANAPRISDARFSLGKELIKIDHHPDHEPYGDLSWINTEASSCSEMIYDFYKEYSEQLLMTTEGARLLYAGIVGDTGRFLYPATTQHTLEVAAELMTYPFNASDLCREIEEIKMPMAKLSGYVWQHLQVDENGAAYIVLSQEILDSFGVVDSETYAVVPLPGQINTVLLWAIFVAQPEGYYRVRMRSKGPAINEIARKYHGGGHPLASGANAKNLKEVQQLYKELQDLAGNFKEASKGTSF